MATIYKALIGKEDINYSTDELYPTGTFARLNSLGGVSDFTKFPDVYKTHMACLSARHFGSYTDTAISNAISYASGSNRTIYLEPGTWTISNNLTIPKNICVAMDRGAVLSVNSGKTLTLYNIVADVMSQHFSGAGTFTLNIPKVYPHWFGCAGDDVTDDFAAFQLAMTAAAGRTLIVPKANYYFALQGADSPSISIYSDTTVDMDRGAYIKTQGAATGVGAWTTAVFKNADYSGGNSNIHIKGGRFKNVTGADGNTFIALYNVSKFSVKDVQLLDINASCRAQFSHCTDGHISDYYTGWEGSHAAPYSFEDGLRIESGCARITCNNLVINSGDDAIAINNEYGSMLPNSATGADITDIVINGAVVTTQAGHGLRIYHYNYDGVAMTAGTIKRIIVNGLSGDVAHTGANFGVSIGDYSSRRAIQDIVINGIQLDCTDVPQYGISILNTQNVHINSPVIYNTNYSGIACSDALATKITNPDIRTTQGDDGYDGILLGGGSNNSSVIGGYITGYVRDGIGIENSNGCKVIGNTCTGNTNYGIRESGTSDYTICTGNYSSGNTAGSIDVDASGSVNQHNIT